MILERLQNNKAYYDFLQKIKSPEELYNFLNRNNFDYGFVDKFTGNHYYDIDNKNYQLYRTSFPCELLNNKIGVCWDYVELERDIFTKLNIPHKVVYVELDNITNDTHTFLIYKHNNLFKYFEYSFLNYKGIYSFKNINSILDFVYTNMIKKYDNKRLDIAMIKQLNEPYNFWLDIEQYLEYANFSDNLKYDL